MSEQSSTKHPHRPGRAAAGVLAPGLRAWLLAAGLCLLLGVCAGTAWAGGELVFGMSAPFSGPARGLGIEYHRGLMAAFDEVNARGGAGGWRLKLALRDDAYDPATTMRNTIAFVEQDRVFSLLGYVGTPTTARVLPLLKLYEPRGVTLLFPLTGADMLREPAHDDEVQVLRASYLTETRTLVNALVAAGRKRIAVFHQADVYGRNGWDGVRRALGAHRLGIVAEATYRRGASFGQDFRREVASLLCARPDCVIIVGTAAASAAFIRNLRDAGFTGLAATLSFSDSDNTVEMLQSLQGNGRDYLAGLVFSQVVPCYEDERLPAVRAYRQAMAQARSGRPPQISPEEYSAHRFSFVGFEGYLAGQALAKAVERMGAEASRQRLRAAFSTLDATDLGLGEKVDLRPGLGQGIGRTYLTVFRDGRFAGVDSLRGLGGGAR